MLPALARAASRSGRRSSAFECAGTRCLVGQPVPQAPPQPSDDLPPCGQPTGHTHPWLLREDEVAPGVTHGELAERRRRLAALMPPASLAVVPAAPERFVTGVIPYPYRQAADFYYLTGITQPGVALLHKGADDEVTYTLLVPHAAPDGEVWHGRAISPAAAIDVFGADVAAPLSEASIVEHAAARAPTARQLLCDGDGGNAVLQRALPAVVQELHRRRAGASSTAQALRAARAAPPPPPTLALAPLLHALRWRKSAAERAALRASAAAAAAAISDCMAATRPGVPEAHLAAQFAFRTHLAGAPRLAYPTVVGAGANACVIHYGRNDARAAAGDLVLLDGGCELWGYASDVTRTWPAGGRFSPPQRAVYDVVAAAHAEAVAACVPGATLRAIHERSAATLAQGLRDLGVAPAGRVRAAYPHSVGHWLGLDTHDCATVSHGSPLEPGVALTVEPGLYLQSGRGLDVPRGLEGVGVRIEDDVLVTAAAPEVLSRGAPVAADEVEALVGSAGGGALGDRRAS